MDTKREADELVSRCVALVIFYQHLRKTRPDRAAIDAELRGVAATARRAGVAPATLATDVLGELELRYDRETARGLYREFIAGFTGDASVALVTAWARHHRDPARAARMGLRREVDAVSPCRPGSPIRHEGHHGLHPMHDEAAESMAGPSRKPSFQNLLD